uniref:BCL2 associated athanogene 2 n=1 Tax=Eptatretus burgeri TaxID=7764 RepID=A0A8C4QW87_EPTBU
MAQLQVNKGEVVDKASLFQRSQSMAARTNHLVETMDQLETRVEALRDQASAMEQEKETLLEMLHGVQSCQDIRNISDGEREELNVTAERLINRVLTVDISLETVRDQQQEESLNKAMEILDEAALRLKKDMDGSKRCLSTLLQACLPDEGEAGGTVTRGPIDQKIPVAGHWMLHSRIRRRYVRGSAC